MLSTLRSFLPRALQSHHTSYGNEDDLTQRGGTAVDAGGRASLAGPTLIELLDADIVDWGAVVARVSSCPHEASLPRIMTGQSPLCLSIAREAPDSAIRAILDANPEAAQEVHWHSRLTPLYFAVAQAGPEVVQMILNSHPPAARQAVFNGCIPLHAATDVDTARRLIDAYPRGIGRTNDQGYLPLHRVAYAGDPDADVVKLLITEGKKYNVGGRNGGGGVFVETRQGITPIAAVCETITGGFDVDEFRHVVVPGQLSRSARRKWNKLKTIFEAAQHANVDRKNYKKGEETSDQDIFRILHTAIELEAPDLIVQYILQTHSGQCVQQDSLGQTPLSIAASKKKNSENIIVKLLDPKCRGDVSAAGMMDKQQQLPLHRAIASGRGFHDAMRALIDAAPRALETRDGVTQLYPFMMAAVGADADVDLVYTLLKETPWLVKPNPRQSNTITPSLAMENITHNFVSVLMWILVPFVAIMLSFLFEKRVIFQW
eukprot:CAMPEP_0183320048 /NCGR_PEP_ID=MMETSP0160_2-20130417/65243_1 /TAXON_ID=2839 ORGANISM="Odontella Sinensis, Strain Grunow 1884" /NCGR_SAMPLE_ID=MMETSP0160_2 /ASSEMBLY_ACC=CAM_ASM_000250 /LENGTH=487 /DNA_ID=CAMNT_0025486657 /DNA_START=1 /DNA_END=1464 /DNA_ORIENTATION=+